MSRSRRMRLTAETYRSPLRNATPTGMSSPDARTRGRPGLPSCSGIAVTFPSAILPTNRVCGPKAISRALGTRAKSSRTKPEGRWIFSKGRRSAAQAEGERSSMTRPRRQVNAFGIGVPGATKAFMLPSCLWDRVPRIRSRVPGKVSIAQSRPNTRPSPAEPKTRADARLGLPSSTMFEENHCGTNWQTRAQSVPTTAGPRCGQINQAESALGNVRSVAQSGWLTWLSRAMKSQHSR